MDEERERPRPHGDPLEIAIHHNPEDNRVRRHSDAPPEEIPRDRGQDFRDLSDRAKGRSSTADGIPEFDEDAGTRRKA